MPLADKHIEGTLSWNDLEANAKAYPENEKNSLLWIKFFLGYIPKPHIYVPHLAFIQAFDTQLSASAIEKDVFYEEVEFHVKKIRNDDMKQGNWISSEYQQDDYEYYETFLAQYKQQARSRLCTMLGYEPKLEYSLGAEVMLRQFFQFEYLSADGLMPEDYKAATIAWYREIYFEHGAEGAEDSELAKRHIDYSAKINRIFPLTI